MSFNAVLWTVLAAFFFIVAYARADDAYSNADVALVSGLRIIGSACAIAALLYFFRWLWIAGAESAGREANPDASEATPEGAGPRQ
jgi:NhaP-type Na+/H+ or K+/H+ antiporter